MLLLLLAVTVAVAAAQSGFVDFQRDDRRRIRARHSRTHGQPDERGAPGEVRSEDQCLWAIRVRRACRLASTASRSKGMGFQSLKDTVTVSGQNLQRNYTLKLGTLQETITVD